MVVYLNGRKWILEVEGVGISIYSTKLHHLGHNVLLIYSYCPHIVQVLS